MASVRIDGLDIVLGGNKILEAVDLEVEEGEFLVLLGPSGCGKSTLLHTIAGFHEAARGSIRIGDKDVTWADPKDRDIGMVFQSYALYPTMNVERNLSFGLRASGFDKAEITRRVDKVADMLHLRELLGRRPSQLSGGQRQRVAIGRALVRDARVFLFDEPLSNLDAKLRAELRRELKQLHRRLTATMIYVTHDQVEAMTMADRIAVMSQGVIQQIGTPGEIYARPANRFVAGFLGSPTMNMLEGRLMGADGAGATLRFESDALASDLGAYPLGAVPPPSGTEVVLGVRPEHVRLAAAPSAAAPHAARVSVVEPLGSHQIVWLDCAGKTVASVVDDRWSGHVGDTVAFGLDATRVSLFDARTELRL